MDTALIALYGAIIGGVTSGVIGVLGYYFKKRSDRSTKHEEERDEMAKKVWRLQKTIIILAKILDEQVSKAHPELQTELEGIAKELLSGENDD